MASFGYEAIDASGKTIKGSLEADAIGEVKGILKSQGLILVSAKEQGFLQKDIDLDINSKPKPRDLAIFCRQFVSMTKAGVTLIDCLRMLADQTENKMLKKATEGVRVNVEKGETLADSLAEYPKVFPDLMINMVAAGESSGSLDVAVDRMGTHFEKAAKTKALVKKAMIYPVVVLCVALVVIIAMLLIVIPRYTEMFNQMDAKLPGITLFVKAQSDFMVKYWFIVIPVIIGVVAGIKMWSTTSSGKYVLHAIKLKIPALSNLEVKQSASMMARTLSTLMAAGVPLVEAVEIVSGTMTNVYFRDALENAKEEIMIGQPLSRPLEECGLFPPMVYHMLKIGEETGDTEGMLTKLADYYDEEVEMAVQSLTAAMEPMIIILLAGIVGFLIAACMAPMVGMYAAIDRL
ncbi:MAG: type II secretion system F family protein [Lachnospiraceae bacterium]|nr:type II secretion system F family protein [Lachnospiraceae bacterium]